MKRAWDQLATRKSDAFSFYKDSAASFPFGPFSSKNSMLNIVIFTRHYFQIFYSIIRLNVIFMMNNFAWKKFSSKMTFHYMTMFQNNNIVNANSRISSRSNISFVKFLESPDICLISAMQRTIFVRPYSIRPTFKNYIANIASNLYPHETIIAY